MEQDLIYAIIGGPIGLIGGYLYWCALTPKEGRYYNVVTFNRFSRTISGVRDRVYNPVTRRLENGTNTRKLEFIFKPFQRVDEYMLEWDDPRESPDTPAVGKNNIGNKDHENAVLSFHRIESTDHHRDEHNYHYVIKSIETGEPEGKPRTAGTNPENVKIDSLIQATVKMESPFEAQYRNEAKWPAAVQAAIGGTLGEVISEMVYGELRTIRGEKLATHPVKNTDPSIPKPKPGDPEQTVNFLDRINYEIQVVQRLGVRLINLVLVDYDVNVQSIPFLDALQRNAISKINLETAENDANALKKKLTVKEDFIKNVLTANKQAIIDIKKVEDVTVVRKAQAQQSIRTLVEGQNGATVAHPINVQELVQTTLGLEMAGEIRKDADESKAPDTTTPPEQKQHSKKHKNNRNK